MPRLPIPDIEPYLRVRSSAGSSFRADGARFAYRSNESGLPQLWLLDLERGSAVQHTFGDDRVAFADYAPVGQSLIYGSDLDGNERYQLFHVPAEGETPIALTADPDVIHHWGKWSPDGRAFAFSSNGRNPAAFDVYVREMPSGEPRRVLEHDSNNSVVAWAPDSDAVIVSRPTSSVNNDLFLLDLKTGDSRHLTPHAGDARFAAVDWLPDRGRIILITDLNRDRSALATMDLGSGELQFLAKPPWVVEGARLSPDGRRIGWRTNEDGYSVLRIRDLASGQDIPVPELPRGVIGGTRWSPDGRRYAITISAYNQNSDVWLMDLEEQRVRRLTQSTLAGLDPTTFVEPVRVRYRSVDGLEVPAFLYQPLHGQPPFPTIVSVHGGPESQERPSFAAVYQYLVARGYAVLAPNVRGSTGYGRRYTHLDDVEKRMDSVADLRAAWEWLVDNRVAEPSQIAVMGGSYGGFMVLAALTTQPELWAAGVDIVGIANFITFLENTGPYRRALREAEYGSLERDAELLKSISPIHHVDRIRAPLMVVHGANDPRVPVGEAEQIVAGLRARGAPVEYMRFEDEGHGIIRLENRLIAYPAIAEFLDRYLGIDSDSPG